MSAEYVVHNNDFSRYDEDPRMILVKVDRNNTHYYTDTRCPKCGGTGYIPGYEHVEGGVCFMCGGSGRGSRSVIVRTYEYNQKLVNARLEKARKTAGERNAKYLQSRGFSVEGFAWIVMGKTFEIKDKLKAAGPRKNVKGDPESVGEDEVVMRAFTGMLIGVFKIVERDENTISVELANGTHMDFDVNTGKEIGARNPRFANRIEL